MKGQIEPDGEDRLRIVYDGYRVVLSKEPYNGKQGNKWLFNTYPMIPEQKLSTRVIEKKSRKQKRKNLRLSRSLP